MSTPVTTDKWAGNFDCDFCKRKRLMGEAFSKSALTRYRKEGGKLKCKECVQAQETAERNAAAAKRAESKETSETRTCVGPCQKDLAMSAFSRNQWAKGDGKSKCQACVENTITEEASQQKASREEKLRKAKENVEQAKASKNPQAILKAESELAALEAERVTGLKPVSMRSGGRGRVGRGRGRGRGGGRGRGR